MRGRQLKGGANKCRCRPCLDLYYNTLYCAGQQLLLYLAVLYPVCSMFSCGLVCWGRVGLITHWTNINQGRAGGDLWNAPPSDTILTPLHPLRGRWGWAWAWWWDWGWVLGGGRGHGRKQSWVRRWKCEICCSAEVFMIPITSQHKIS